MKKGMTRYGALVIAAALTAAVCGACSSSKGGTPTAGASSTTSGGPTTSGATPTARGFDGRTITIASVGLTTQLPGLDTGVKARITRFNSSNEIPGVQLKYLGFLSDGGTPSTALTEMRQLVTQDGVFAIVGDESPFNTASYMAQQQLPYFGYPFDATYCSPSPTTTLWGFGFLGCLNNSDTTTPLPDLYSKSLFPLMQQKSGKSSPTMAIIGDDIASDVQAVAHTKIEMAGAGFHVVYAQAAIPPNTSDYTPYALQLLKSESGHAPDVIYCLGLTSCIQLPSVLSGYHFAGGYVGSNFGTPLLKPLTGTYAISFWGNPGDSNPAARQMTSDFNAVAPGGDIGLPQSIGYFSADMFIAALKIAAKSGKSGITPQNLQKAASTMTYSDAGLIGPLQYPASTVLPTPGCLAVFHDTGTAWETASPLGCSNKTFPQS